MAENPFGQQAELHPDFVDPVTNPDVPFVSAYDPDRPDPVPPAERLAQEPETVAPAEVPHFSEEAGK